MTDTFDPAQAVDGAARLLQRPARPLRPHRRSRWRRTTPAPGAVLRYDGIPPYPETQNYVRSVMSMLEAA